MKYLNRDLEIEILRKLKSNPVVAVIGPRQCGKSTLIKNILKGEKNALYLDLERPSDINKLRDAESFFYINKEKLICLDEIQRIPDIFPVIRSVVDERERNGQFIILGSASPDLLKQSSESLAGRISYLELTPFLISETGVNSDKTKLRSLWLRGGFPRSFLAVNDLESFEWRIDFIRTFLEKDIPLLGFKIPIKNIERLWRMCAHVHGQVLNRSKLGDSLGVTHHTVQKYLDLLSETFLLRIVPPYEANLKKRLIKSPKIYIRDSGILHALLSVENQNDLFGHPSFGPSWEGFALENIISSLPNWNFSFFRTSSGNEIDLILERGTKRIALEFKASTAPKINKGFYYAIMDLNIDESWIISPVDTSYPYEKNVWVSSPSNFIDKLKTQS